LSKEDIKLDFTNGNLEISGNKESKSEEKGMISLLAIAVFCCGVCVVIPDVSARSHMASHGAYVGSVLPSHPTS